MKRSFLPIVFILLGLACETAPDGDQMLVKGNVKGLKKGKLYLQTLQDSTVVSVDSLLVEGDGNFEFATRISEPDIFYLYLDKADNNTINDRIMFFGEPGEITITTEWDQFEHEAEVKGSEIHEKLQEYQKNSTRFNTRALELAQLMIAAQQNDDDTALDSLLLLDDNNLKRNYLYSINFAVNNRNSYLAPFIAVNYVPNANPKLLDSVYNSLSPEVAASKYGLLLKEILTDSDPVQE